MFYKIVWHFYVIHFYVINFRLLGIPYNMWLDSTAQRRYIMDGITELACFLRKNRDLSIENSLRLIECTLAPLLVLSGPVIIWPEKEFKRLTAAFVRCSKEAWQMSPNTSTALFTFPKDQGGLQIKMPRAIICPAVWGHLPVAANSMTEHDNSQKPHIKMP